MTHVMRTLILGYQRMISPYFPPTCRFSPSCSQYALDAYGAFGFWKASWLTAKRLSKCHPWHQGGHDPVDAHD